MLAEDLGGAWAPYHFNYWSSFLLLLNGIKEWNKDVTLFYWHGFGFKYLFIYITSELFFMVITSPNSVWIDVVGLLWLNSLAWIIFHFADHDLIVAWFLSFFQIWIWLQFRGKTLPRFSGRRTWRSRDLDADALREDQQGYIVLACRIL